MIGNSMLARSGRVTPRQALACVFSTGIRTHSRNSPRFDGMAWRLPTTARAQEFRRRNSMCAWTEYGTCSEH